MSVRSVLRSCHKLLETTAADHRFNGNISNASQCQLQAEAVLRLLAEQDNELDNEQEEETSDD